MLVIAARITYRWLIQFLQNTHECNISRDASWLVYVPQRCEIYHVAYTNTHPWLQKCDAAKNQIFVQASGLAMRSICCSGGVFFCAWCLCGKINVQLVGDVA